MLGPGWRRHKVTVGRGPQTLEHDGADSWSAARHGIVLGEREEAAALVKAFNRVF